jgi:hypothetical protein
MLARQALLHLSHNPSPFCVGYFQERVLKTFPRLALNLDPPDHCLLSRWDYRHEPLTPSYIPFLAKGNVLMKLRLWTLSKEIS